MSSTRMTAFGLMAILSATGAVFAADPASFFASASPSSNPDSNGTTDVWSLTTQGNDGGAGDFQGGPGNSWALYSYGSPTAGEARMDSNLSGGSLSVGQTISIDFANRFIATGKSVGVSLLSSGSAVLTLSFVGGSASGNYLFTDAVYTERPTGIGYNFETLTPFIVTRTGDSTYSASFHGNQWTGVTAGAIDSIRVFNFQAGDFSDVFSNNLGISAKPTAWTASGGGTWSDAGNWDAGTPDAAGASAVFGASPAGAHVVNVDGSRTVQTVLFSSPSSYTLSGTGSLTMAGTATTSLISATAGSHTISVPVTLTHDSSAVDAAADASLSIASLSGSGTLTKTGLGVVHVDALSVGSLSVVGGTMSLHSDSLPRVGPATVSVINNLYIGSTGGALGTRVYNSTLDIGTTDLVVRLTSLAEVSDAARGGQNGATLFGGAGLTSSVAAADANGLLRYAVGVIQNDIGGSTVYDTFDGVSVGLTDVLVKFTYFGDADLNGVVDDTDFFLINNGYGNGLTGWVNGDFDYSGTVDDTDFFLINNAYGLQGSALRAGGAVPEPTGMGVLALAGGMLLGRRRK